VDIIPLRSFLPESVDPALCKLHCAVWNGENHPIDVLARDWEEWTDWNRWRSNRDEFNRQLIFSLARDRTDPALWLFGGIFEVLARRPVAKAHSYDVTFRDDLMAGFVKRLWLRFERPSRTIRLNMETHLDRFSVHSLLPRRTQGRSFPATTRSTTLWPS